MPLRDQIALVTGAGRGIGRATALALAQAGAHVSVNDLDPHTAAETVAAVASAGVRSLALPGDVSDLAAVEGLVSATVKEFGRLDLAVANAYYSAREAFWQADLAKFRRTIDVTMWGAFYTLRAATRQEPQSRSRRDARAVSAHHAEHICDEIIGQAKCVNEGYGPAPSDRSSTLAAVYSKNAFGQRAAACRSRDIASLLSPRCRANSPP